MEELCREYAGFLAAAGRLVEAAEGSAGGDAGAPAEGVGGGGGGGGALGGALGGAEAAWERLNVLSISLEGLLARLTPPPPPPPSPSLPPSLPPAGLDRRSVGLARPGPAPQSTPP